MTILRNLIATGILATGLFLAPVCAWSANNNPPGSTSSEAHNPVHPTIAAADAQREKEAQRKRYLLLFPLSVVIITAGLIIITRRKR